MAKPQRNAAQQTVTPTADQSETIAKLTADLAAANAALALANQVRSVAPVAPRRVLESESFQVGQDGDVTMPSTGDAHLNHPTIEVPDGPVAKSFLDELAFNEELVTVRVSETTDPKEGICISTWNDGRHQLFIRGEDVTVKRKFLEVLARSKPVTYANVEYVDAEGNRAVKYPKRTANRFPFAVIRDDNPRGGAWLRKILAEA